MSDGELRQTRTVCPYCGVGCGLVAESRDGRLTAVAGDPAYPVNRGRTCAKPLALPEASAARDRATVPLRREPRAGRWREAGWDETIAELAARLAAIRAEHGPDAIAFYISGQLLTEDYYVIQKLAKGFLGTNNVDSNSRLCMSSAVAGYKGAFGSDGPPPAYEDIASCSCFLLLGSNAAACHPIVWARIRDRQAAGATVIVADPRETETARGADLHLPVLPGTDLALLNAMLYVIDHEDLADRGYIDRCTEGYEAAMRVASRWPPARAAQVCGVRAPLIAEAARRFAASPASMALWSMGANQSTVGTLKNRALLNLCLASGQSGRPGAGPLSLTGQPNAMGGRETGGLAQLLPGYREVASPADRAELERYWELPGELPGISPQPGLPATELFEALEAGRVKAVWICATNPIVSLPDASRAAAALRRAELVVCQDAYHPTETSALADVVLPAAQWPEKEGTMTNSERRVGLVRQAIEPPGQALPDWRIFARLAAAMGWGRWFDWAGPAEVYDEFAACTAGRVCDQSGISHERLRAEGGIQWPCPAAGAAAGAGAGAPSGPGPRWGTGAHPGTVRLYADGRFHTPSGRARFEPTPHRGPDEAVDEEFPLLLTTGRVANQWHTMTRTGKSGKLLDAEPEPFVELSAVDAERAGVRDGEPARLRSRRGVVVLKARVLDSLPAGVAFAPFHWGALHAPPGTGALNRATNAAADPTSKQPELKACAVRVEPVRGGARPPAGTDVGAGAALAHGSRRNRRRRRLLVVGTGMAAQRTVESLLERRDPGASEQWEVTMLGREPDPPYNRIMLSRLLGRPGAANVELRPSGWYATRGIELRCGVEVERVDPERQRVHTVSGERLDYDALVLATGSRPLVPPIAGVEREGVLAFRTRADAREIAARARGAERAVVIGGGLLGLEAARGLLDLGLRVSVVHLVDRLMETQLDRAAARLVTRRLRNLGVEVLLEARTEEVVGNGQVEGLRLAGGERLEADLVVVATGIRPEVGLAERAGIEVGRGILVDDEMRTSAPGVWAVGECAEHRGRVYGVVAPLLEQARVAGATIVGDPGAFLGATPATTLKVMGVELFCAGQPFAERDEDDEVVIADARSDRYRKLVLRDGRMIGAILLGDLKMSRWLSDLARTGARVPDELFAGLLASEAETTVPCEEAGLVCSCNAVTGATIRRVAGERGLLTVEEVMVATKAGTGCGSCAPDIRKVLAELEADRTAELRHARSR